MPRLHLFEFNDRPWLPEVLRNALTGYLATVSRAFRLHHGLAPIVRRALADSGAERIVDLCSGSGGPVLDLRDRLRPPPPVVLTDRFPNLSALARAARPGVTWLASSTDAADVPPHLVGLRTIINAFHHFRPDTARRVLADAVARRAPILVIELSERRLLNVLLAPSIVPLVLAAMPFVRPSRWQYWLFTYAIPLIPLMTFWDGVVSHLRAYSREELLALAATVPGDAYCWRVDRVLIGAGLRATVLFGRPR